ncbi:MAG: S-layer homology domain-containing protein [Oscillospiraceae bacterium]|nr:S-layer homology domain-containing protein [Oscillospiraceae bacterium]
MKRIIALLLTLALLLSLVPAVSAARPREITAADYAVVDALWAELERAETLCAAGSTAQTAAVLAAAVRESELYVEGSLRWKGEDYFTFETTVGVTCGYSARLMARVAGAEQDTVALAQPETRTVSYARRGTTSSMDVYLIEPYYGLDDSFSEQYQTEATALAETLGGTYNLYTRSAANITAVAEALEQGGVVFFDTHGETDFYQSDGTAAGDSTSGATTSYILLHCGTGLTDEDYAYDEGVYHATYFGRTASGMYLYAVDGTVISNHMDQDAPNSLLWSATCLGMATDGLVGPLLERGVGVAYGYSQSVTFYYDYLWEEVFFDALCRGETVAEAVAKMKTEVGQWDLYEDYPVMAQAIAEHCAFPIVVSAEDAYPGHGQVDGLQTVNSLWELPLYVLTLAVNDESLGTVTREGSTVTVLPNENADFTGWTLSPEDAATVTREGDILTVTGLTADCCLTVEFTEKPLATVHYVTPEGTQKADETCYVGQTLTLTAPEGTPAADGEDYVFCGWTTAPVTDSPEAPELLTGEFAPVEGEQSLYALYTYREKGKPRYTTELRMKVCYAATFKDVNLDQWYHEDVDFALGEGYMQGFPGNTFQPGGTLTRAQLVTILYRLSEDGGSYSQSFTDVGDGAWYADAVAWAHANGVVTGFPDGSFQPNAPITREQAATILYRYAALTGMDTGDRAPLESFTDADRCAAYALEPMQWVVAEGIINGVPAGNLTALQPKGNATRAQIAAILHRYCDLLWNVESEA